MNTNRLLAQSLTVVLLAVLFVPLVRVNFMLFPFITGKNFLFRILVEIALALWIILAVRDSSFAPRRSPLLWAVIAWLLAASLSTIFGVNPFRSFWSNYERMEGLVTFLHLGAFFFVLTSTLKTQIDWRRFFNTSLIVSLGVSLYALLQWFGVFKSYQSVTRLESTLGNSAYLAMYLLFHVAFALLLALWRYKEHKNIYPYLGLAGFHAVILFLTQTRGTLLGLLAGLLVALFLFAWTEKGVWKKRSLLLLGATIVLIGVFIGARNTTFVQNNQTLVRFASISLSETTTASRFTIWKMGWEGFKERPLLGWGPENYTVVFNKYYEPSLWRQEPWFDRAHNVFFDWLIMGGIVGFLSYLALPGLALYLLYKTDTFNKKEKIILFSLGVGYLIHNIFVFDNVTSYISFFAVLAFINQRTSSDNRVVWHAKISENKQMFIIPLVILACLTSFYFFVWRGAYASYQLIGAFNTQSAEEVLSRFNKVFSTETFGSPEAVEQFIALTGNALRSPNLPEEVKRSFVVLADQEMKKAITRYRGIDARQELIYASFLGQIGVTEDALTHIKKAKLLSPQKQQIMFEEINIYGNVGRLPEALLVAKEAFLLDETYPEARKLYATLLVMTGKSIEAEKLIMESTILAVDARIIQAYKNQGKIGQALTLLTTLEKKYPEEAELYFLKASVYLDLGNKTAAITALEKGKLLDPNLAGEADTLIAEIKSENK